MTTTTLVDCPECGLPATARAEGTGGPVPRVRLHCVLGHRSVGPARTLPRR